MDKYLEEQKAKAEAILAEVKANPDNFEQIAMKKSEDKVSGERGGELGFFSRNDMVKEFSDAAFAMKPNTISENLVKTNYGFHIIKVTDRAEAGTTPFVKVKDEIKFYLETQEQVKVLKNLTDGLMKTAKIEYIDSQGVFNGIMSVNATETTRTLPTNGVTSDGWTFGGWYYDANFTKPVESNVIVELDFKEVYNKSYGGVSNIKSG